MYLLESMLDVKKERKNMLDTIISEVNRLVSIGAKDSINEYEEELLRDFNFSKMRIDILMQEDAEKEGEIYEERLTLSALNMALHYIMEVNPDSELRKHVEDDMNK